MSVRRVVTGKNSEGKSVLISDGASPREHAMVHTPGFVSSPMWKLEGTPDLSQRGGADPMNTGGSLLAPPGGAVFLVVTFPPDAVMASPAFKPEKAFPEQLEATPGIIELFEPDAPGMHTTPTVDFACVLSGEIVLELDDGVTVALKQGDTVVQQGARHAWRNPGDAPATLAFAMIGATGG